MDGLENTLYKESIKNRFKAILVATDLTISGFTQYIGGSESHYYSISNGTRNLSEETAKVIGKKLGFTGEKIFNLTFKIPTNFNKVSELNNFKLSHKTNPEYFRSTLSIRKKSKHVENIINQSTIFDKPIYLSDAKQKINEYSSLHQYNSDQLSKILNYLVTCGKLSKVERLIKLKNGKLGKRIVDVFFKNDVLVDAADF